MATAMQLQAPNRYDQAEVVDVIRQTVCKGASDSQLRMFLEICRSTRLDPFLKEIFFVADRNLIMASRDGYLRVANEHPQFDGMETRVERDKNNVPVKATCSVWRKDRTHAITCEAYYSEYKKSSPVWSQYPSAMISKVAEVLALKRSFAINGVVTEEELSSEPRGSAAAAQAVALQKLAVMTAPQPAVEIIEQQPEEESGSYTYEEEVEMSLEEKLEMALEAERQRRFQSFTELQRKYTSLGFARTYDAILALHGVCHASEFPDTEEGIAEARVCYREMAGDLAARQKKVSR